jgi:manganese/zinc/iron transport system permease protein
MAALQDWNWQLDGWIVVAGSLCAAAAALLGNFLVLRRMSMLGDAISHAVLPGLAAAFLLTGSRSSLPMFLGAVVVGVLTALLTEWIRSLGRVDEGAAMGVVFTSLFALGLVLIVQAADQVHLDPGCVLYGAIESTPLDTVELAGRPFPRVVLILALVLLVNATFVVVCYKELKISTFDPALATTSGIDAGLVQYLLVTLVAMTAVASFESVGNILVVAMFVVPPATAYLLTDRLAVMIVLSVVVAVLSGILGHVAAIAVPNWFGYGSTNTAGMMAVAAGTVFALAALLAPRHGVLTRLARRQALALRILSEDVIALLFRSNEKGMAALGTDQLAAALMARRASLWLVLLWLRGRRLLAADQSAWHLTPAGRQMAGGLVRSHRLWEQYLVSRAELPTDRIHDQAERLEHFTDGDLRQRLSTATDSPDIDPHGTPIPPEP